MSFAIMRFSKLKSWAAVGSSGSHTYRTRLTPNANPEKLALNRTGRGTKGDVLKDVKSRVFAVTDRPRSNAVLALEFLLSASPEWFDGKSSAEVNEWANASTAWLKRTFGDENLVHVVLHRDESTPHLVAYVVPEKNGKLNARGFTGTPELVSSLQTEYADAMANFGLQRGIKGSRAEHQTVRDWYGHLNQTALAGANELVKIPEPTNPPDTLWMLPGARREALEAWKGQERGERRKIVQEAAKTALQAVTARHQVAELKQENGKLSAEVGDLRKNLSAAYEALGLSKEEITQLRKSNTTLIAQRLGYSGAVEAKENAIDLLKRVAGFDYSQSVAWLHAEFGPVITGSVVSKSAEQTNEPRPFTKTEKAIKRAVDAQLDALDCERYRITLISYDQSQKPFLPGKRGGKNNPERFYTRDEIIELIPFLRYQNNQGMNVLLTPIDDRRHYMLIDDVRLSKDELENRGFRPCLYQATSWNSNQAVLKVHDGDRAAALAFVQELNREHGDPQMQALRQGIRLAGFRNMKPKHLRDGLYPFVRVLSAVNRVCNLCARLISKVEHLSTYPQAQQQEQNLVMKL